MAGRRGVSLLEVLVALVVLAVGVGALQRLLAQSVATIDADARLGRAALVARTLLAEAALAPPEPGHEAGTHAASGLAFEREVTRTPHPGLREVRVRVAAAADGRACELVELIRVAPR
jgi:prepilin-type N-terminal cleavage/methylation domain-containing protein